MSDSDFSVLQLGGPPVAALPGALPFVLANADALDDARLHDAVLVHAKDRAALAALTRRADLPQAALETAVVVAGPAEIDDAAAIALLRMGVQDVLPAPDDAALARALRHAIERKRLECAARQAYATDLATGLPHQAQLLEHMNQLLALREREPGPMVLIVLRIDGFAATAARLGAESVNVLRRKVAVRLRGGLRASDVVSSIGPEAFGVLLGQIEAPSHGERVVAKLVRSLQQPFQVAGTACTVTISVGLALYPEHGKDAQSLLRRASAQALSLAPSGGAGGAGLSTRVERSPSQAANDDDAT